MRPGTRGMKRGTGKAFGLFLVSCFMFQVSCFAASSSGAAFLKIDAGARSAAMGGAVTAQGDGAGSVFGNPAGLLSVARREAQAGHSEWLDGISIEHAAYAQRLFGGTAGVGYVSMNAGAIDGRDLEGRPAGAFSAQDSVLTLCFAKRQGNARLGAGVKMIEQRLAGLSARGTALDLGVLKSLPLRGLTAGLAVQNLGPKMAFEEGSSYALPMTWKAGLSYAPMAGLVAECDLKYLPSDKHVQMVWGTEYQPLTAVALRAGYILKENMGGASTDFSSFAGLNMGVGLSLGKGCRLDYGVTSSPNFGLLHNVSLSAKF